jgi:antitoxin HicB
MKTNKGTIDRSETLDEFLAKDGLLAETEDAALKEIIADQIKAAMKSKSSPRRP